jgi:TolB protein
MRPPKLPSTLLGFAALALLAGCQDGPTQLPGDSRDWLLVVSGLDGDAEIYAMRPDGSERRRLTDNTVADADPDWSPDGRRIVFVSAQDSTPGAPARRPEVFVMNADGSGMRRLHESAGPAAHPRWSPDGQHITFERYDTDVQRFRPYIMNSDGTGVRLLSAAPGENFSLEWSPDGSHLLFLSNRSPRNWWTMYVMRADGTEERQVAGDEACFSNVDHARWSPDGTRIVYVCTDNYEAALYGIGVDGTGRVQLASPGIFPVWSPDGEQLAFSSNVTGSFEIYLRDQATGAISQVTDDGVEYFVTSWRQHR